MGEEKEMSLLGHIYELRIHLVRSGIAIIVAGVICGIFWGFISNNFIMAPLSSEFATYQILNSLGEAVGIGPIYPEAFDYRQELKNLAPVGQITAQIYTILICGLILAIPYIVFEIWRFIKPGLTANEKKYTHGAVFGITFFFLMGVLFSYYLILPFSISFLFVYDPFGVPNEWTLPSYTSLFVKTLLGMGLMFLFPVFAYFFARVGVLSPQFLRTYRRHAVVVIMVIAAIITPSDIMSMVIAALPLLGLYELSIWIVSYVFNKQLKEKAKDLIKK